jgi:hypothetical protein
VDDRQDVAIGLHMQDQALAVRHHIVRPLGKTDGCVLVSVRQRTLRHSDHGVVTLAQPR